MTSSCTQVLGCHILGDPQNKAENQEPCFSTYYQSGVQCGAAGSLLRVLQAEMKELAGLSPFSGDSGVEQAHIGCWPNSVSCGQRSYLLTASSHHLRATLVPGHCLHSLPRKSLILFKEYMRPAEQNLYTLRSTHLGSRYTCKNLFKVVSEC